MFGGFYLLAKGDRESSSFLKKRTKKLSSFRFEYIPAAETGLRSEFAKIFWFFPKKLLSFFARRVGAQRRRHKPHGSCNIS
jgi:hypothetical protein